MNIGLKIKKLRLKNGLTLEELANRTELSKGFLSQLERDKTTTSIHTLLDILDVLGTTPVAFFDETSDDVKIAYDDNDYFIQENDDFNIAWLISNAQKNIMEPIVITLFSNKKSNIIQPFEGEAFGYVLEGKVDLVYGERIFKLKKNNSFYIDGSNQHHLENNYLEKAIILWIASPPIF